MTTLLQTNAFHRIRDHIQAISSACSACLSHR